MGVDYTAILAVGKEFEDQSEAFHFLDSFGLIDDQTRGYYEEDGSLEECLPCNMDGGTLNYYTGYGFYIGYRISCRDPKMFQLTFEEGKKNWDEAFGGKVEAEIIHTVVVS